MPANAEATAKGEPKPSSFLCGLLGHGVGNSRSPEIYESEAAALGLRLVYRIIDLPASAPTKAPCRRCYRRPNVSASPG